MALRDASMVIVLGEDPAHLNFVWHWLRANGVDHHRIRKVDLPAGGGGWRFVVGRYREEVASARRRNKRVATRLVVVVDADDEETAARRSRLAAALGEENCRANDDPICVLVPRRHIETWVHALTDAGAVEETARYKPKSPDEIRKAARALATLSAPPPAPPSLVDGYEELLRLRRL
jgi:hypothetical protein